MKLLKKVSLLSCMLLLQAGNIYAQSKPVSTEPSYASNPLQFTCEITYVHGNFSQGVEANVRERFCASTVRFANSSGNFTFRNLGCTVPAGSFVCGVQTSLADLRVPVGYIPVSIKNQDLFSDTEEKLGCVYSELFPYSGAPLLFQNWKWFLSSNHRFNCLF